MVSVQWRIQALDDMQARGLGTAEIPSGSMTALVWDQGGGESPPEADDILAFKMVFSLTNVLTVSEYYSSNIREKPMLTSVPWDFTVQLTCY